MIKLGIIREGKNPPDKRVPLTPQQCVAVQKRFPQVKLFVQPSAIRSIPDSEYALAGIPLQDDLSNCDILMGVKEVRIDMLIPGKTYLFFSHTYKKQAYNRSLLQAILAKKISLIDYELLTDARGRRIVGFGRYAGIVGCYNALLALGLRSGLYQLKPAHQCQDRKEVEAELKKVRFPDAYRIVLTGKGRVAGGAIEMLDLVDIDRLEADEFMKTPKNKRPAYTQLGVVHYNRKKDGSPFTNKDFYERPCEFESNFMPFARVSHMYISCHYWDERAPFIFSREDARRNDFKIDIVADISCDIDGPVASTLRPSTISEPLYGYDPKAERETKFDNPDAIGVMAVDNLPCELPQDASADFGQELLDNVLPELLSEGRSEIIERARESNLQGELTQAFAYLQDYVEEV